MCVSEVRAGFSLHIFPVKTTAYAASFPISGAAISGPPFSLPTDSLSDRAADNHFHTGAR